MHLGDASHSSLNCVFLKEFAPIIHGDIDSATVLSYQLGMVDNCRPLSHLCYVIDAPTLVLLNNCLKRPKYQSGTNLDQQKGQSYLLVELRHHPPHQVINHEAVFILSRAVVGMKMDFSFTKGMVFKKMVEHRYKSICSLPYLKDSSMR